VGGRPDGRNRGIPSRQPLPQTAPLSPGGRRRASQICLIAIVIHAATCPILVELEPPWKTRTSPSMHQTCTTCRAGAHFARNIAWTEIVASLPPGPNFTITRRQHL